MTDPSLDARALAILDDALELPSAERDAFARTRCGDDPPLLDRVLRLLRSDTGKLHRVRTGGASDAVAATPPPERIGPYRITGLIGQGGMGAVYRGQRDAGDFDHVVAIKLIRPGALSDVLIERFQRERQTLASLSHPNIARLFDGGETAAREPYIVMEYVAGRPLGAWLGDGLGTRSERTALFLQICSAVGFAHQNLVIHRDLTPSNILITDEGSAKLIDFGIARPPAIADEPPTTPSRRSPAGVSLTPGFAAPERLAGAPATTLSDIYSLGILLDRMLGKGGDGDLGAIIAKATAADPADRYRSVDALAEDIAAWRDGHPVAARAGGRGYALAKFVRRHRAAVAASAAALLLLIGALAAAVISYDRAERARVEEVRRFADLRSLAGYMLFDLNDRLSRTAGNTEARASLAAEAQKYLSSLAASPSADAALRLETARGLVQLARVQGVPGQPTLGDAEAAKRNLLAADRQLAAIRAGFEGSDQLAATLATARAYRAIIAIHEDENPKGADALYRSALATLDAVPAASRDDGWRQALRSARRARLEYADIQSDTAELGKVARQLAADAAGWPAPMKDGADARFDAAVARYYQGLVLTKIGKGDQGLADYRAALDGFTALERARPGDPNLLYWMSWAGLDGYAAEAQTTNGPPSARLLEAAQSASQRLIAVEPRDDSVVSLARSIGEAWAQHLANIRRFPEAIAAHREVIAREKARIARQGGKALGTTLGFSEMVLGVTAKKAGDRALACDSWRSAEARFANADRLGKLLEFQREFVPGLRRNLALCAAGRPLSAMPPLK